MSKGRTVGFEVFTAVVMNSSIFWDITSCSPLSVNWRFLLSLCFRPWRWKRYVPPKRRLTLNGLRGVVSKKMVLFNGRIRCGRKQGLLRVRKLSNFGSSSNEEWERFVKCEVGLRKSEKNNFLISEVDLMKNGRASKVREHFEICEISPIKSEKCFLVANSSLWRLINIPNLLVLLYEYTAEVEYTCKNSWKPHRIIGAVCGFFCLFVTNFREKNELRFKCCSVLIPYHNNRRWPLFFQIYRDLEEKYAFHLSIFLLVILQRCQ
jgi:hypothetical protein